MPELPDVEGFRRVAARASGERIDRVEVADEGVLRGVKRKDLQRELTGTALGSPRRHGKWLVLPVRSPGRRHARDQPSVVMHFGMTGSLTWVDDSEDRHRHDRVVLVTDNGELRYRDMRKLQGVRLARDDDAVADLLGGAGPDAGEISATDLAGLLGAKNRQLKPALMDQSVVAGLGNLLVDEILWRARLHPQRSTSEMSDADLRRLHARMRRVLRDASEVGHVPPRRSWLTGHRDEPGDGCPRCGTELRRTRVGGRRTVWCPNCQPA